MLARGAPMDLELVIANGTVVDGTGAPRFRADVGVARGRIARVSRADRLAGARAIDASGLVVAPGFVDVDSHADWAVIQAGAPALLARWVRQGVTTVIGGACGFSPAPVLPDGAEVVARLGAFLRDDPFAPAWGSFGEFLDAVAAAPLPLNVGFLVGQNTIRAQAAAPETRAGLEAMVASAREALRGGALGLSANAGFAPGALAAPAELAALATEVARAGRLLAVHARAYTRVSPEYPPLSRGGPHNVRAVREVAAVGRSTGARVHVFHVMAAGRRTWGTCEELLRCVDAARADVDLSFDAAPYTVAVGPLQALFPSWFAAASPQHARPGDVRGLKIMAALQRLLVGLGPGDVRLRHAGSEPALVALEGRPLAEIARALGTGATEARLELARRVGMNGASVLLGALSGDGGDDGPLRAILSHPLCAVATNAASARTGPQNPSVIGAFPRVLGRYVRDERLLSLEEAVRRMTSFPAERVALRGVGRIAEGYRADLTIFDPATIADPADPERADAAPLGIRSVVVAGVPVVEDGRLVDGALPGRVLRAGDA